MKARGSYVEIICILMQFLFDIATAEDIYFV